MIRISFLSLLLASAPVFSAEQSQLDQSAHCAPDDGVAFRVLFIGDSITRHGVSDYTIKSLGWSHVSGMAASKPANDYPSILSRKLSQRLSRDVVACYHTFGGSGTVAQRLGAIGLVEDSRPDLVVIQLGEHEQESVGRNALADTYRQLIKAAEALPGSPKVVALGPWSLAPRTPLGDYAGWPGVVDETMRKVAGEQGVLYSSVKDISALPEARGFGTSEGVKWHPNDIGHMLYAVRAYRLFLMSQ